MATQEERHLLQYLNDPYTALGGTGHLLIKFREDLFSGQYRNIIINSKGRFDAYLERMSAVFYNSYNQVQEAINLAGDNIMPAIIHNIRNLNRNMRESYAEVIAACRQAYPFKHRAQISARVDETINILKKLRESIHELGGELNKRRPPLPHANKQNGSSRKRKRTHRKRTHHKRKRTHRKHRK